MATGAKVNFVWVIPPSVLQRGLEAWGDRVVAAVKAVADYIATQAQNDMRTNAPWVDRTGNARNALFSYAEQAAGDVVSIYLSHGSAIYYGRYLELNYAGKYAIIVPTLQRILPQLEAMLKKIFS